MNRVLRGRTGVHVCAHYVRYLELMTDVHPEYDLDDVRNMLEQPEPEVLNQCAIDLDDLIAEGARRMRMPRARYVDLIREREDAARAHVGALARISPLDALALLLGDTHV